VWITPGALIGAILWLVVSLCTKIHVAKFPDLNASYGTVGGVMVVLLGSMSPASPSSSPPN
jgi:membrane protein